MINYHLSIVTPTGKVFEDDVSSLVAPGVMGSFGVLAKHAPTVAALKKGILKVTKDSQDKFYTIGQGFLEMDQQNQAMILVDIALEAKNFQEAKDKLNSTDKI